MGKILLGIGWAMAICGVILLALSFKDSGNVFSPIVSGIGGILIGSSVYIGYMGGIFDK